MDLAIYRQQLDEKINNMIAHNLISAKRQEWNSELEEINLLIERNIKTLQPAIHSFSHIFNQQESIKADIINLGSTIELGGEEIKIIDFVTMFDEILSEAISKVISAAKNTIKIAFCLNNAIKNLSTVETILAKISGPEEVSLALNHLGVDLKQAYDRLQDVAELDLEGILTQQKKLNQMCESFIDRNLQLKDIITNPPLHNHDLERPLVQLISELKATHELKHKINKLLSQINK